MRNVVRSGGLWALFMILVLIPTSSDAGFLVEFHNGRRVWVEAYRMEGKSCELYFESGSLRVSREDIKSIQEKKDSKVIMPEGETEKDKPEARGDLGQQGPSKNTVPQRLPIESYLKRRAKLREQLEEAKKAYFDATEKTEKDWARQKMISFSRELFSLEEEVKQTHNGSLPDWWKQN